MELLKIQFINCNMKNKNGNFAMLASRHCYLIEHVELLIDVISFVLLVQMLFSCLIISLIGKYLSNCFSDYFVMRVLYHHNILHLCRKKL